MPEAAERDGVVDAIRLTTDGEWLVSELAGLLMAVERIYDALLAARICGRADDVLLDDDQLGREVEAERSFIRP